MTTDGKCLAIGLSFIDKEINRDRSTVMANVRAAGTGQTGRIRDPYSGKNYCTQSTMGGNKLLPTVFTSLTHSLSAVLTG